VKEKFPKAAGNNESCFDRIKTLEGGDEPYGIKKKPIRIKDLLL
jgi:hypothetical protein